ncbi:MAG: hypothetical protein HKP56_10625 [Anderseniella sp.]|jgi:hypothetical protein|nr:hypothetical protein [Anderseniella sp.]
MVRKADRNEEAVRKAQADLKRLGEQSEKILGTGTVADDEPEDRIEMWGKRIGRSVAYVLGAYLIYYFLRRYGVI